MAERIGRRLNTLSELMVVDITQVLAEPGTFS